MAKTTAQPVQTPTSAINLRTIIITAIITAFIIGGIVGGLVYAWQKSVAKSTEEKLQRQIDILQTKQASPTETNNTKPVETKDVWQKYTGNGFDLLYPTDLITASQEGFKTKLEHSISYNHNDPCDFQGNSTPLNKLTDFKVEIQIFNMNLEQTLNATENKNLATNYLSEGTLKTEAGFIDNFKAGKYDGYQIFSSVEGCGEYQYYSPINSQKTLFVTRALITEFQPIIESYSKNLALPGVITPDDEKALFEKILATINLAN